MIVQALAAVSSGAQTYNHICLDTEEEIARHLLSKISPEDMEDIKCLPKLDLIGLHSSLGRFIRNEYKLWERTNELTKQWHSDSENKTNIYIEQGTDYHPDHPDEVTGIILQERDRRRSKGIPPTPAICRSAAPPHENQSSRLP